MLYPPSEGLSILEKAVLTGIRFPMLIRDALKILKKPEIPGP